jgi:PAS domain S-box-containing protein
LHPPRTEEETKRLVHELEVHQIELEMQNAELHQARDEMGTILEKYTDLYDFAPVGYFTLDRNGTILAANLTGAGLLGIDRTRLIGRRYEHFITAATRPLFTVFIRNVFESRAKDVCEVALLHEGKNPLIVQIEAVAAMSGHECRVAVIDITERKNAEVALLEQKEFLNNLLQNSAAPIFVLDAKHKVVIWNRACEELTGIKAADIVGSDELWKAFYDHRRPVLADLILDGKQGEMPRLYHTYAKSKLIPGDFQAETWFRDNKGVERYIFFNAAPIRNVSGEIIAVIETLEDLTEMKLAEIKLIETEEALKESESTFKIIAEQALIGIFMHEDGRLKYVNPKFGEIFGYSVAECIDTMIFQKFIYPEDIPLVEDQVKRRLSGDNPTSHYQFRGLTKNKEIIYLELYGSATLYNKKPVSIGTILDITDRKKAEDEKLKLEEQIRHSQKMEAVGTLAGGIAHDFNNILMAMTGYCALIERRTAEDSPIRTYLDKLVASTERAAALTRSLLAYSRKQSLNAKPVDLNAIVKKVEDLLSRLLGEDIELAVSPAEGPLTVIADSLQIEQVLMNLSTNARDAMLQGGILKIATDRLYLGPDFIKANGFGIPGRYALLTVSDSGSGMDETTRERIFEPFFTTKEVNKGTGLGLSIAFGIIKQHNGYLIVSSELGKGTTFNIYLPLTEMVEMNRQTTDQAGPIYGCETILLVEDDEKIRTTLKELLENNGYTVIEAVDGEDGINRFHEFKDDIELIILDMIMPKKNGKAAYEEMKAIRPGIRSIFLSGYSADILNEKGILQEDMTFIHKPVVITDLLRKIREVLDK